MGSIYRPHLSMVTYENEQLIEFSILYTWLDVAPLDHCIADSSFIYAYFYLAAV